MKCISVKANASNNPVQLNGVTFIIALRGREYNIGGFAANVGKYYPDANMIFVIQADNEHFNKGALYNLGFKQCETDIVVFADIDIRHRETLDFKGLLTKHNKPFVPFTKIAQIKDGKLISTSTRPTAWGACTVFTKQQFIDCGGYPNNIQHWGYEDMIIYKRAKLLRIDGILDHIHHDRLSLKSKELGLCEQNKQKYFNDNVSNNNLYSVTGTKVSQYEEPQIKWIEYKGLGNDKVKACPTITEKQQSLTGKKDIVFNQFFGIGDILFIEPIIRSFFQKGHKVILPILPMYLDIQPYFPYITMVDKSKFKINYNNQKIVETDDMIIYPVRWSMEIYGNKYKEVMLNKYRMFNLDLNTWRKLNWKHNAKKENDLFDSFNIKKGEKYNFVNTLFTRENLNKTININNGLRNINLKVKTGYTLLDWSKIIINAETIHTVSTSVNYMIEVLPTKAKEYHIYSRTGEKEDFELYNYLFEKPYKYHLK